MLQWYAFIYVILKVATLNAPLLQRPSEFVSPRLAVDELLYDV